MSRPLAMKNPAHPGELIRDNIDELGLSVTEAAKGFGVVLRQQLHNIIAGRGPITPEMAVRLEKSIGRTDTWLRIPMNYDLAQSRKHAPSSNVERLQPKVA